MNKLSVIIPNFNHASFLKQRIDSVLNQTFRDFEVIILDDNSTDDSRSVIESYKGNPFITHIVYNDSNSGSTFRQWEKGVALAKSEYIWIAESDDYCDSDFLETMMHGMMSQKNISLGYCRTFRELEDGSHVLYRWGEVINPAVWEQDQVFHGLDFIKSFLVYRNVIPNASAVIFKKECFKSSALLRKMTFAADWVLWTNIAQGGDIFFCSKPMNYFRQHDATTRSVKPLTVELQRIREYFIAINEACRSANLRRNSRSAGYDWIIDQWMSRRTILDSPRTLFPPYPFSFLLRFYKKLVKIKTLNA